MPATRRPIKFDLTRDYTKVKSKGKISEIIDFHMHGKNRYMKINQPVSPRVMRKQWTKFKNPKLNQFEGTGEENYEPQKFVFDYQEGDDDDANDETAAMPGGGRSRNNSDPNRSQASLVDESKVNKTVNMIENLLKENKKDPANTRKAEPKKKVKTPNTGAIEDVERANKGAAGVDKKRGRSKGRNGGAAGEDDGNETDKTDQEKQDYLDAKKIVENRSTDDSDEKKIVKKPAKKNVTNDLLESAREYKTIGTQTPRENYELFIRDPLQDVTSAKGYVNKLIDDVQTINNEVNQEPGDAKGKGKAGKKGDKKGDKKDKKGEKTANSLGLAMEGKNGINMAIIKGDPNKALTSEDEQVLLKKNYQNLEELIQTLMADQRDDNYLKLAKLNRLKVLMELSMKMVGRKYKDIKNDERNTLELEANRFHTTYPLPGELVPLEEVDAKGVKRVRMPLKIVDEDGAAKIDINAKYRLDPSEFITLYTKRLINHAEDSTGLQFDNITVTVPAAYGTMQREAIKNSVNEAAERDDVNILTRPVAAAVILNNKRTADGADPVMGEVFKVVFDMTEVSLDSSVIRIRDSKDFHVLSNVGDTSFGLHDIDQRIVEHIINEKAKRENKAGKKGARSVETVNAYSNLVKSIKVNTAENGAVTVDLATMSETDQKSKKSQGENDLLINKTLISKVLCKDIYDWSLAHIDKSITQADVNAKEVDEIIIIGSPGKMPGFYEYLKEAYPKKQISFVYEDDLAVGAAIVGRKLKYQQIKVTEVLCRSIGIGLYTGVISFLLFRNSSLPCIGGCVYSSLVDDQETMVLDVYEGERPHVKYCRYLGEVTVLDLPKGPAGSVKCELHLKMNSEGILEVIAKDLKTGKPLKTVIDANPDHLSDEGVNNDTDMDPIEAERYKKPDRDLVYELESLDQHLEDLSEKYRSHKYSKVILDKIFDTKEYLYKNRKNLSAEECRKIKPAIDNFLKKMETVK